MLKMFWILSARKKPKKSLFAGECRFLDTQKYTQTADNEVILCKDQED